MEYDSETQKKIARHFAIAATLGRLANEILPIEQFVRDDAEFFEQWMQMCDRNGSNTGRPAEVMLKLLQSARDMIAAHKELQLIGEMLMMGSEDTGKYKM
jgi:hypothetical protein